VVENVIPYYEALILPTAELNRHCFWANFPISNWSEDAPDVVRSNKEELAEYHGLKLPDTLKDKRKILRNAVYPPLGKHILDQIPKSLF
jgi:DNA (cytosine-5)-methyltransferase 1